MWAKRFVSTGVLFYCSGVLTHLLKWLKSPLGLKPEMTQFTGVLIAHVQPSLHAELVYKTQAAPAVARTN